MPCSDKLTASHGLGVCACQALGPKFLHEELQVQTPERRVLPCAQWEQEQDRETVPGARGQLQGLLPIKCFDGHASHPSYPSPVLAPQTVRGMIVTFGPGPQAILACLCQAPSGHPLLFWGPGATHLGLLLLSCQELPPRRASIQAQARQPAQDLRPPGTSLQPLLGQGLGGEICQPTAPAAVLEAPSWSARLTPCYVL